MPRTVLIDEAIVAAMDHLDHPQVVLVGAGLDTRAWRMPSLGGLTVFSVDHPASQADARDRSGGLSPVAGRLLFVPVDLTTSSLDTALARAGHDRATQTIWIWEGVVPYLRRTEVAATTAALAARSAPDSVLVVAYQAPSAVITLARRVVAPAFARFLGLRTFMADEPWRSTWSPHALARLAARNGFVVEQDLDLWQVARALGSPVGHGRSLRNGRVAVARYAAARVAGRAPVRPRRPTEG